MIRPSTTTVLSEKGQVTLPRELVERLNLKPGDILTVTETDGAIILKTGTPFARKSTGGGLRLEGDDVHDTAELFAKMGL